MNLLRFVSAGTCLASLLLLASCTDEQPSKPSDDVSVAPSSTSGSAPATAEAPAAVDAAPAKPAASQPAPSAGNVARPETAAAVGDPINLTDPSGITKPAGAVTPTPAPSDGVQVIAAEPTILELGEFSTSETKAGVITLRNTSDTMVTVQRVKPSCGCTTADFIPNTVLAPNETTEVTIRMRGGPTARELNKKVDFIIEGHAPLTVPIHGKSLAYVEMTPDAIVPDDMPDGRIVLRSIDGQPFKITSVSPAMLIDLPEEAAAEHEVFIDWTLFWEKGISSKINFNFDHPLADKLLAVAKVTPKQRATLQDNLRRQRGDKVGGTTTPGAAAVGDSANLAQQASKLIKQGNGNLLIERVSSGALDANMRDTRGQPLLSMAASDGPVELVEILIEKGADIEATDRAGRTPLMAAGHSKDVEIVRVLLEAGADVSARDPIVGGALAWSCGFGNAECVRELLDAGAEVETIGTATGWTPLIWASGFGDPEAIPMLVEAGANLEARDILDGATPVMHAVRTGKAEGVRMLIAAGADLSVVDQDGRSPFMLAASHGTGTVEKLQILLEAGADPAAKDNSGQTALDLARKRTDANAAEVVAFLEAKAGN